jgi:hypothetical protein
MLDLPLESPGLTDFRGESVKPLAWIGTYSQLMFPL